MSFPLLDGHAAGGRFSRTTAGASWGTPRYSTIRSTELKSSSTCARTLQRRQWIAGFEGEELYLTSWREASAKYPAWTMTNAAHPEETELPRANTVVMNTTTDPKPAHPQVSFTVHRTQRTDGVVRTIISPVEPPGNQPLPRRVSQTGQRHILGADEHRHGRTTGTYPPSCRICPGSAPPPRKHERASSL